MRIMKPHALAFAVMAAGAQLAQASAQDEAKGFIEDARLDLLLRNVYWNRDYKDHTNDAKVWGQGFIDTFESGFTQGTVGFGVDAYGLLGVNEINLVWAYAVMLAFVVALGAFCLTLLNRGVGLRS